MIPASARRTAESTLKTPCSVARPDEAAEPTIDPDTLQVDRGASTPLWSGLCTLRPGAAGEREQGGQVIAPAEWTWITSIDVPDFHPGDIITVSEGPLAAVGTWIVDQSLVRTNEVLRRHRVLARPQAARA